MTKQTTVPLRKLFDDALSKQNHIVHSNHKKRKRNKWNNKTGFFRLQKVKCKNCKQGFTWIYRIISKDGDHRISRTDLLRLRKDIKDMGFEWFVVNEEKAAKTAKEANHKLSILR